MTASDPSTALLAHTLEHAQRYLASLPHLPVGATAPLEALRARLCRALPNEGHDPIGVIDDLVRDTADGLVGSAGGRFFAWVIGGSLPVALAADWLTSTWDQNAAIHACSPAQAVIEEACGLWLKELLCINPASSFAVTTGTQMSHLVALAAARHALLKRRGWDVEERGLQGAPPLRILTSGEFHGSVERAVRLLGMGKQAIISLPSEEDGTLSPATLERALDAHGTAAIIVILQAGDLNLGAFDDFSTLIPMAHGRGAWVHVDGAFGLWVSVSARFRHLTQAIDSADSWATDGHKWLNVPYDCGYVFVADRAAHFGAISHRTSYMIEVEGARDQIDWTPEWSRRGRALATYAAIAHLGRQGVRQLIERNCDMARVLVTRMGELEGAQILCLPRINQGLVRFLDPRAGATDADHDRRTDAVISAVNASGEAFFGGTTWRDKRCMRVSVCNWRTTENDVAQAVRAVAIALYNSSGERLAFSAARP